MKRYNIFNQIHKGLRVCLYDTALALQQTDFENREERTRIIAKVEEVIYLFDDHAHNEDKFILPAVERYDASITKAFEQEHVLDIELSKELSAQLETLKKVQDPHELVEHGVALMHSFIAFMTFNLKHMAKEEELLNNLLWKHYADTEILQIAKAITASLPPKVTEITTKWMMKGLSNNEIVKWLQLISRIAPAEVLDNLLEVAAQELSSTRYEAIEESFTLKTALN